MIPTLFKPRTLSTPISKVLVSTETNNKLYKSISDNKNNINTIILNIIPKYIYYYLSDYNSFNTGKSIFMGYTPKSVAMFEAALVT